MGGAGWGLPGAMQRSACGSITYPQYRADCAVDPVGAMSTERKRESLDARIEKFDLD